MHGISFKLNHTTGMNKRKPSKVFHNNGDSNWLAEYLTCFSTADLKSNVLKIISVLPGITNHNLYKAT